MDHPGLYMQDQCTHRVLIREKQQIRVSGYYVMRYDVGPQGKECRQTLEGRESKEAKTLVLHEPPGKV